MSLKHYYLLIHVSSYPYTCEQLIALGGKHQMLKSALESLHDMQQHMQTYANVCLREQVALPSPHAATH